MVDTDLKHPFQPLMLNARGNFRFKPNALVQHLAMEANLGVHLKSLNTDPRFADVSAEDRSQFLQLLGLLPEIMLEDEAELGASSVKDYIEECRIKRETSKYPEEIIERQVHPIQPLFNKGGELCFKGNKLVYMLLPQPGAVGLNIVLDKAFSYEFGHNYSDLSQLVQLCGVYYRYYGSFMASIFVNQRGLDSISHYKATKEAYFRAISGSQ